MKSDTIILPKERSTCGNCEFHNSTPDLAVVECVGVPPTPCIVGATQLAGGLHYQLELMRPWLPRGQRACALWKLGAHVVGATN